MANARTNGHDTIEQLGDDLKALRHDFATLISGLKDAGLSHASEAADAARSAADHARHGIDRASTVARRRAQIAIGETEKAIANRPGLAALAALGLGVAVGALIQALVRHD